MERLSSSAPIPQALRGAVLALGNFDGFHRGHQAVVATAREAARAAGRPLIVATFDPHPVRFFHPDAPPFRLTSLDQRERLFAEAARRDAGVRVRCRLGSGAGRHVRARLAERARRRVPGGDRRRLHLWRQSRRRRGPPRPRGAEIGLRTEVVVPVVDGSVPVSSSRIREALRAGDAEEAARLLTRPFAIQGTVQHGDKLGRTIGYPTANLTLGRYLRPAYGIYAVRGRLPDGRVLDGVANLGVRPQFDPPKELLEPYFFDFTGRPLRPVHRGGAHLAHPPRGEVRQPGGAGRPDGRRQRRAKRG
jgi:riboflavin kinase/FMN adenylyltransferase